MMKLSILNIVKVAGGTTLLAAVIISAGCGTQRSTLKTKFDSTPVKSQTNMSRMLACIGDQLQQNALSNPAYVFMVRDVIDGTVKNTVYTDGPLADSGRLQMISTLSEHTQPTYAVVTDHFPLMFKPMSDEDLGLNRFGLPSQQNINLFQPALANYINMSRQHNQLPLVSAITPLVIDGAFTRYDSSTTRSKGYGQNAGYRGDTDDEQSTGVDFGKSASVRSITLVVNIIDPRFNVVIGTESFDLLFYNKSKRARLRVAVNQGFYGFSSTDVEVESLHAAQQTLLDAAAVWILDNAFGSYATLSPCFKTDEQIALGTEQRQRVPFLDKLDNSPDALPEAPVSSGSPTPATETQTEIFIDELVYEK